MDDANEEKRVTFRIESDTIERLDDLIIQNKAKGNLDREVSRSDILRQCVEDKIDELEESAEGNRKAEPMAAD
jgi:hypothetical protein